MGTGGGGGQLCIRDILIPSMGMGRFLLSDRHGIFVQFSRRKITWLGVICITELDLVTQHYPLPSTKTPSPTNPNTQTVCAALAAPPPPSPPSLPCLYKTTNYQINIPNSPHSPFTVLGRDTLKLARKTSVKEKMFYGCMWLCVCLCVLYMFCMRVWSGRSPLVASVAKKIKRKE